MADKKTFKVKQTGSPIRRPKVQRAIVEARLHPLYGEVPVARYIASPEGAPTTMEIRNHCRAKLAGYKIPLMFSVVTELPLTASGKLKRV